MTDIEDTQADGYYDEADLGDEEIDLRFLDENEEEPKPEPKKNV